MFTKKILEKASSNVKGVFTGVLVGSAFLFLAACAENSPPSSDEVAVSVDEDRQPSPIRFEGRATPVLLPRTNMYIFLTSNRPLYYRDGQYFQFYREHWYASEDLSGPWKKVSTEEIPDLLQNVPPEYYYDNFPYKLKKEH